MCGIAGYWGTGTRDILNRMGDSLTHRGPDDGGVLEMGSVGLAHRRLSIVDLSPTGHQPMSNDSGDIAVVFNGEIYNHHELREVFLKEYAFKGSSDTEVLLHLYEEFGEAFLEKIKGMFAIAMYDVKKGTLLLARDHLGKKPLYWTRSGSTLIFGSELKALRTHPLCPSDINQTAITEFLVHEYIQSPATIYTNIFKLAPGTSLTFDGKEIKHSVFAETRSTLGSFRRSFSDAQKELYTLLDTAVQKRMVADVPVGIFLSGGLDSSTIAYFAQKSSARKVKTFSIGFDDTSFDESNYAREVAQLLGTEHHERIIGPNDLIQAIKNIPNVLDEPMADSSIIPTLAVSAFTSDEVKVVLGGDGADELFFGYDTYYAHQLGMLYEHVPKPAHRALNYLAYMLPVSHGYMSFDFKLKKFLSGFETSRSRRNTYWLSAFTPEELSGILTYDVDESKLFASTDAYYGTDVNFWDSLQMEYLKGYLAEDILVKTDRAGMAHGLEVRAPFLDIDLVNFALSLPLEYKLHGRTSKYVLKEMMKEHLPQHIISRKKKGFNIPIGAWIRGELKDVFHETILNGALIKSGLFKRDGLAILLEAHITGTCDNRKKLWTLFVLALWMERWA